MLPTLSFISMIAAILYVNGHSISIVLAIAGPSQLLVHKDIGSSRAPNENAERLLKVKFEPAEESELSMLDVEHEWSSSQRQSILSSHIKVVSADVP